MPFSAVAATMAVMLGVDALAVVCIARRVLRSGRIHWCSDGIELDLQVVAGDWGCTSRRHHTRQLRN